jgi:hypothetical protein
MAASRRRNAETSRPSLPSALHRPGRPSDVLERPLGERGSHGARAERTFPAEAKMNATRAALSLFLACLPALGAEEARTFLVDDFEHAGRVSRTGASWMPLSDAVAGGATTARVSISGDAGKRALRLEGTLAPAAAFAGVWVALDGQARAVDLTGFSALRLKLKGKGEWLVGLRAGAVRWDNYMAPASGTDGWKTVEVPLAALRSRKDAAAADLAEVRWLGVQTASGRTGDFALEIDDVELVGAAAPSNPHGNAMNARIARASTKSLAKARWKELGTDPAGDGKTAGLPDLLALASWTSGDVVWFRLTLASAPTGPFGLNLVLDVDGDPANGQPWWGTNTAFRFDRLVTVWANDVTDDALEGTIGIASADDAMKGRMIDPSLGGVRVAFDAGSREVHVGVPRAAIGKSARVVAAVGSPMKHNDDLPDSGAVVVEP